MLDDAAIRCATSWRYRPAFENGRPVPASWTTNVQWKLRNGSTPT
jgi:outer membrane biosynthesis protein TonB